MVFSSTGKNYEIVEFVLCKTNLKPIKIQSLYKRYSDIRLLPYI